MICEGETSKSILNKMKTEEFYLNGERKPCIEIMLKDYAIRLGSAFSREMDAKLADMKDALLMAKALLYRLYELKEEGPFPDGEGNLYMLSEIDKAMVKALMPDEEKEV